MKGNQRGKKNWGVDRNSIFLIGSVGLRGRVPKGDQEGTGGGVDDSGGRIRVRFLFATERVVLWQVKGRGCKGGRGSEFLWGAEKQGLSNSL